jgi:DNA excision repair protein ERCC-4
MIVIDGREPTRVKEKLDKKGLKTSMEYLDIGDYLLNDSVCIERKTVRDFVASIKDGRIWTQAKNLEQYDHAIIAIIGSSKDKWETFYKNRSKWIDKSWIGTLASLSTRFNVSIIPFDDEKEFISYLVTIENKLTSNKKSIRQSPLVRKATTDNERAENNLCTIPGISIQKAKTLLKHFGNVKNLANAGVNELQHCQGIGKKLAENIHKLYNHEYKEEQ